MRYNLSDEIIEFLDNAPIKVASDTKENIDAIFDFDSIPGMSPQLKKAIQRFRFKKPTLLQSHVFSHMINSRNDLKVHGMNGSGKTLAYLLPIVMECMDHLDDLLLPNPIAIVVTTNYLLANQIYEFLRRLLHNISGIKFLLTTGGKSVVKDSMVLREGCDLLVCTAGRLDQLIADGEISCNRLRTLVIDEADSMLEITMKEKYVEAIFKVIHDRHRNDPYFRTVLVSSTFEPAHNYTSVLRADMKTQITVGLKNGPLSLVKQEFIFLENELDRMTEFKKRISSFLSRGPLIVFVNEEGFAQHVFGAIMKQCEYGSLIYPSNKNSELELKRFMEGITEFLVTTAICSRGLNFPDLKTIVNYDMPITNFEYICRIGRCIDQGSNSEVYTFFNCGQERGRARFLINAMLDAEQEPPDRLNRMLRSGAEQEDEELCRQLNNNLQLNDS